MENEIVLRLSWPRYSRLLFPAYRYLPGRDPHPTANPMGHSYHGPGHHGPAVDWAGPDHWASSDEYLFGCDLYNHGYWWEAHEEWEGVWHVPEKGSAAKHFLQGLIQVSACHLKLYQGQLDGVQRLRQSSSTHLRTAMGKMDSQVFMGLDVVEFIGRVEQYYSRVFASNAAIQHDVDQYPYVKLSGVLGG